jgi:hypothetical protein
VTDLQTLANLAEVFGTLTIISGLIFAVIQIRQYRRQLRETATLALMNKFQTLEFAQAFRIVRSLHEENASSELNANNPEAEAAAMFVCSVYETVGVLVFRRILPFQVVEDLTGGAVTLCWRNLRAWIEEIRVETSNDRVFEWFQWLVERCAEQQQIESKSLPAYITHRNWRLPRH